MEATRTPIPKVKSILPKLKANRYTYYNLDRKSIESFKKKYAHLKKHENDEISALWIMIATKELEKFKPFDFVAKMKAMDIICNHI